MNSRKIIVAVAPVSHHIDPEAPGPITPEEIADEISRCAEAGAGMVHLHVRDRQGNQTEDLGVFSETLDLIRATSDIVIQGSTGGLSSLSLEERCVALNDPRVETASLNMGSVNFDDDVYINRLPDIRYWARRMAQTNVIPELEVFEAGMIPVIELLATEKILHAPFAVNFCLGVRWGLSADPKTLLYLTSMLPDDNHWGVVHAGMNDLSILAAAIVMGASVVRVGFEDSRHYAPGKASDNNVVLVEKLVSLIRQIGYDIAGPQEARRVLGLPQI
jgi:3-keto-5-aminohexanoate cleavage enzyme